MSLRRILLGFLAERPAHGYGLWRRVDAVLGDLKPIEATHVYGALAALERAGLVIASDRSDGSRRAFTPTESGRAAYRSWLDSFAGCRSLLRRPLLMKAAVAGHLGERLSRRLLQAERLPRVHLLRDLRAPRPAKPIARLLRERAALHVEVELWLLDRLDEAAEPTIHRSASASR